MRTMTQKKGFTLLETLIAITIVGSVGVLIAQVFYTTTRINTKTELIKNVKQNGEFAMDIMARTVRNATKVISDCSVAGIQTKTLQFENPDGNITTYGCVYDSANAVTRIASTSAVSAQSDFITSQNVTLGGSSCDDALMSLSFVCTQATDISTVVNISYRLAQKGTPVDSFEKANQQFDTSVTLRN